MAWTNVSQVGLDRIAVVTRWIFQARKRGLTGNQRDEESELAILFKNEENMFVV